MGLVAKTASLFGHIAVHSTQRGFSNPIILVINIHWRSANVNAILDEADESPLKTFIDSYDAKQVVRPNDKHNNKTWRRGN